MKTLAATSNAGGSAPDAGPDPFLAAVWTGAAPIDRHFALFLERLSGQDSVPLKAAATLLSLCRQRGHVCLDLAGLTDPEFLAALIGPGSIASASPVSAWVEALRALPVVGQPGEFKPLILDRQGRLYLQRYWAYESELAEGLRDRGPRCVAGIDEGLLRAGLERFFGITASGSGIEDRQALASATAVRRTLSIISGGPGTGKTRTVAILLALILEQAGAKACGIALAAPTGKAAARLHESIQRLKPSLPCAESVKARFPKEAFTIHRLLGMHPDSSRPRHHASQPLPFEVVVVDEASMVDLVLMTRLLSAVPPTARLVLLGDEHQLASVEAGSVLGDLCHESAQPGPLSGCAVRLERNYRFAPGYGLLELSRAVNHGDAEETIRLLRPGTHPGLGGRPLPASGLLKAALRPWVTAAFGDMVTLREPGAALARLNSARVLAAVNDGPCGVGHLNAAIEAVLEEAGRIHRSSPWYHGRPILVTRNAPSLGLFNGDAGIIILDPGTAEPACWFDGPEGIPRSIAPSRLPDHETVFAMTVHKSQGSELDQVLLVLPDRPSPVLTRDLIYTGITRASRSLEVWFNEPILRAAVGRSASRGSGLRERLWGG